MMKDIPPEKKNIVDKIPQWLRLLLFVLLWIVVSLGYTSYMAGKKMEDIAYSEFKEKVAAGEVAQIQVKGQQVTGQYAADQEKTDAQTTDKEQPAPEPGVFSTVLPGFEDPALMALLEKNNVVIHAETEETNWLARIFIRLLPWLLIIGFFVYVNKKMSDQMGGMGGIGGKTGPFGFGKSKAKKIQQQEVDVSFEDVAGLENAKNESSTSGKAGGLN